MRLPQLIERALFPLIIGIAWWLVCLSEVVPALFLPSPIAVLGSLWMDLVTLELASPVGATLLRTLIGFTLAAILGTVGGMLVGYNARCYASMIPTVDFLRSIPATALFPLFMLLWGVGEVAKAGVVVLASSLVILVNTASSVASVSVPRLEYAKTLRATRWQIVREVIIYDALPGIFLGYRVGISMSLVLVVVAEMLIGAHTGLGKRIYETQLLYQTPQMYGAIITTGVIGFFLNSLLLWSERKYLHWAKE